MRALGVDLVELSCTPPYAPPYAKRVIKRLGRSLGREYLWEKAPQRCQHLSRCLDSGVAAAGVEAVLVFGSESCAYSHTSVPLFAFADSVFGSRLDFYDDQLVRRVSRTSMREGVEVQQRALDRLTHLFITSRWAWNRAQKRFGYRDAESKVVVTGIGANLPFVDRPLPPAEQHRYVWIGGDWKRKGGDRACAVVEELRRRGVDARLDVAGTAPDRKESWLTSHGRIEGIAAMRALYSR
ncbi:MAG: hypothetical protein ABI837_01875, partial [Acidobacteriota bacterium]